MKKYIALHTYTVNPPEVWKLLGEVASQMAIDMATGVLPAKCIKTWNPLPHGRADYFFCLWDAEKPEDILTSLAKFKDVLTADIMAVDEIDWAELTKAAMAAKVPA
jgi:hypothetical protein